MIALTRDPVVFLARRLQQAMAEDVTYAEIGLTRAASLPDGYYHDRRTLLVGHGEGTWDRAREAVRLWAAHAHAQIRITPANAPVTEGTTLIASRSVGPLVVAAPCRVVYGTDETARFGFAYGTLPGHPEKGEEAFHVVLHEDGTVTAEIAAFSRPDDLLTRAASHLARQVQKATTRRYLEGIRDHIARGG